MYILTTHHNITLELHMWYGATVKRTGARYSYFGFSW